MADTQDTRDTDADRATRSSGIILCPLRYEYKQLLATGIGRDYRIECCGPGGENIQQWFAQNEQRAAQAAWVMLVGLAGAIDPAISPGSAHAVAVVIDQHDDCRRESALRLPDASTSIAITSSDVLIRTEEDRATLAYATGAHLVDQESAYFAACADRIGVRWGIVRGVSDGIESRLPRKLDRWVDGTGRTRLGRVFLGLLLRPGDLPRMLSLGRTSRRAMREAAAVVSRLIKHPDQPPLSA